MPYTVRKSGEKYKVINKNTGRVYGTHDSQEKADKQLAALHINTGESKFGLKQDVVLESNGVITVIPKDTEVEYTDRYEAFGIKRPDPQIMCKGSCEGTGYFPIFNPECQNKGECYPADITPLEPSILALWQAAEGENKSDDGWHFVKCPDCNGKGEDKTNDFYDNVPLCTICNNKLMKTRGIGYTHSCSLPVEQGKNHTITVIGDKAVPWDGTRDHYSRLSKLADKKL